MSTNTSNILGQYHSERRYAIYLQGKSINMNEKEILEFMEGLSERETKILLIGQLLAKNMLPAQVREREKSDGKVYF